MSSMDPGVLSARAHTVSEGVRQVMVAGRRPPLVRNSLPACHESSRETSEDSGAWRCCPLEW